MLGHMVLRSVKGMNINKEKTEVTAISREKHTLNIVIEEISIKQVAEFKYLEKLSLKMEKWMKRLAFNAMRLTKHWDS